MPRLIDNLGLNFSLILDSLIKRTQRSIIPTDSNALIFTIKKQTLDNLVKLARGSVLVAVDFN